MDFLWSLQLLQEIKPEPTPQRSLHQPPDTKSSNATGLWGHCWGYEVWYRDCHQKARKSRDFDGLDRWLHDFKKTQSASAMLNRVFETAVKQVHSVPKNKRETPATKTLGSFGKRCRDPVHGLSKMVTVGWPWRILRKNRIKKNVKTCREPLEPLEFCMSLNVEQRTCLRCFDWIRFNMIQLIESGDSILFLVFGNTFNPEASVLGITPEMTVQEQQHPISQALDLKHLKSKINRIWAFPYFFGLW